MKNVYIIGDVIGQYRTQNIIKALQDDNKKYNVYFNNISLSIKFNKKGLINKVVRKFIIFFENIIFIPYKVYHILISDVFILPAMNIYKQIEFTLIAFVFRKKIITDYYVSFYDSLVLDRKKISDKSITAKKLMIYDRNIIKNSTKVLFLNNSEKDYYLKIANLDEERVDYKILPLCVDEKVKLKLDFYQNKGDKIFNVCWWGTYIPLHGVEKIIRAAELLSQSDFKFQIYLFGNSDEKSKYYKDIVVEKKLENVVSIVNDYTFSNGKLIDFLKLNCDLVLGNFGDSKKARSVLVNKLVDGVAMRAPVLTGESKAAEEFFDFKNDIWRCTNNPEDIAKKIKEISDCSREEVFRRVNNAYHIYMENFSPKAFSKKIIKIIDGVK